MTPMRVPVVVVVALSLWHASASASAAAPPAVEHVPPPQPFSGFPLEFSVKFNVPAGVVDAALQWRKAGAKAFGKLPLASRADGTYGAMLDAADVAGTLEYYIVAVDAKNPKSKPGWQSASKPHKLVTLTPPPHASVTVDAQPPGAQVSIDGRPAGVAPVTRVLFEGDHVVAVTLEGHVDFTRTITVTGSAPMKVAFALVVKPAHVSLEVVPDDAELLIDGFPVGRGKADGELAPGQHRIAARLRGYEAQQEVVELGRGQRFEKRFVLERSKVAVVEAPPPPPPPPAPPPVPVKPVAPEKAAHWASGLTWVALGLAVAAGGVGGYLATPPNDTTALVDGFKAHSITYKEAAAYNERVAYAPLALGASGVLFAAGIGLIVVQQVDAAPGSGGSVSFHGTSFTGTFE